MRFAISIVVNPLFFNSSLNELVFTGLNGSTNANTIEAYSIKDVIHWITHQLLIQML